MSRARRLCQTGDTVFIDGSTSCMQIAGFLKERCGITLVTNSAHLAGALCGTGFDIHCTGGRLIESSLSFVGSRAAQYAEDFHFDLMFFQRRCQRQRNYHRLLAARNGAAPPRFPVCRQKNHALRQLEISEKRRLLCAECARAESSYYGQSAGV